MIWLSPLAWVGALLVGLPILIHLLGRGRARVLRFPTLRFIDASRLLPTKRSRVQDPVLLAVRCAIVLAAVAALAGPLLLTTGRKQTLDRGLARAIVVDTTLRSAATLDSARQIARRLATDAQTSVVVETGDLATAVPGAVAWLERQHRRGELAIVSDFRVGAIDREDLSNVPAAVGIATYRVAVGDTSATVVERALVGNRVDQATSRWANDATEIQWTATNTPPAAVPSVLVLGASGDTTSIRAAEAAARTVPVALPVDTTRAAAIVLPGYPGADTIGRVRPTRLSSWEAALVGQAERAGLSLGRVGHAAFQGREHFLIVPTTPAGSAATVQLIALARQATSIAPSAGALETRHVGESELSAWNRAPASAGNARFRPSDDDGPSDARWLWLVALALLVVEWQMRRRMTAAQPAEVEVHERAA